MRLTTRFDVRTFLLTLLIGGVLFVLVVVIRYCLADDYDMRAKPLHTCLREAKTGDLVCVSYQSKRGRLVRVFTGSVWIHIGIVVRTPRGVWVMEAARYSPTHRGLLATPLEWWLDYNAPHRLAWRPYRGTPIVPAKLLGLLRRHHNTVENLNAFDWLQTMYKTPYQGRVKGKYYCSEFVAHVLQEVGVLDTTHDPSGYKPWELLYGISYREGCEYDAPVLLSTKIPTEREGRNALSLSTRPPERDD